MSAVLQEIITLLVSGISQMATGIGSGLTSLVSNIFLETDVSTGTQSLSVFGGIIVVFAGIALAVGLCRWVVNFLTSFGKQLTLMQFQGVLLIKNA